MIALYSYNNLTPEEYLQFEETSLIKHDFKTLTSDLRNSYFYTLYGDLELRNKVSCLVPNMQLMTPTKMEIWLLEEPPNMFFNNKLNES